MDDVTDEEGGGAGVLTVLAFDGVLVGGVGLAFTPLYIGAGACAHRRSLLTVALVLPWLVLRAGEIDRQARGPARSFAWFATVAVLGLAGPGGDVLLPGTWQSLLLFVGGVGASLWALRRVRDPRR